MSRGLGDVYKRQTITRFDKAKPLGMQRLGEKKRKGFAAAMYRRVEHAG